MYAIKNMLPYLLFKLSEKQHITQDLTYIYDISCNIYVTKAN